MHDLVYLEEFHQRKDMSRYMYNIYIHQEGNHTPSTKPILHERVTGDELHDGSEQMLLSIECVCILLLHDGVERCPVDRGVARRTKSKHNKVRFKA